MPTTTKKTYVTYTVQVLRKDKLAKKWL